MTEFRDRSEPRPRSSAAWAAMILATSLLAPGLLPAQEPAVDSSGFPRRAQVLGTAVNVRTGPSTNHFAFTQLRSGSEVIATGRDGEWVRFHLPASERVWISAEFVEPTAEGHLRVTGDRVRLRATPGTQHQWVGLVHHGAILRPTGERIAKPQREWLQCQSPLEANGWMHATYLRLGEAISREAVAAIHRGLAGTSPAPAGASVGTGTGEDPSRSRLRLPRFTTERLTSIYESIRAENAKRPVNWNFDPILVQLRQILSSSEDQAEVQIAGEWVGVIEQYWLPIHARMVELEKEQEAARKERELAEAEERQILKKPGHRTTQREKEFLAVGWVATLGTHRKVDGTHRLLKGNRLLFYLKSEQWKLDDFVNRRVGIVGVIQEQPPSAGAQLIHVTDIKVLSN